MDIQIHTVGERASRTVLDGVEMAKKELGDAFRVRVTCAHLEIQDNADFLVFDNDLLTAEHEGFSYICLQMCILAVKELIDISLVLGSRRDAHRFAEEGRKSDRKSGDKSAGGGLELVGA